MSKKVPPVRKRRFPETIVSQRLAGSTATARGRDGPLLTIPDVARILHSSRSFVYTLLRSGELPSISIRRLRRVRARDLDEFIKAIWSTRAQPARGEAKPSEARRPIEGRLAKWRREHGQG